MHAFLKTGKLVSGESPSTSKSAKNNETHIKLKPWVEKYRPKSIDDVVHQDEVVAVLKKTLSGADVPNLLFYGPPGTGKTSTILAAAKELFGDIFKERVMELNASDERGIQVIREKVKHFAQTSVSSTKANGQPCPPFKIIILDEADSMTSAAQAALRRTMEQQSKTTRFCLLCNYVSRIIDPLTSRCSKFRFKPLDKDAVMSHLTRICKLENVDCENGALELLIEACEGDLRRAITSLQSVARLRAGEIVTRTDVSEVTGMIPNDIISDLLETCKSNSYDKLSECVNNFILDGYSANQLISQIHDVVLSSDDFNETHRSNILEKLADCDYRLCDGADEYLQIMDLTCTILEQLCRN